MNIEQKKYVLGFALSIDKKKILLIKKNNPDWQKGLLNGLGGKIELYDNTPQDAMSREFKEECGVDIPTNKWKLFNIMDSIYFKMFVFWTMTDDINNFSNTTDEVVGIYDIASLYQSSFNQCVPNLSWLIGMLNDPQLFEMQGKITYG